MVGGGSPPGVWVVLETHTASRAYDSVLSAVKCIWDTHFASATSARNSIRKKLVHLNGAPTVASRQEGVGDRILISMMYNVHAALNVENNLTDS